MPRCGGTGDDQGRTFSFGWGCLMSKNNAAVGLMRDIEDVRVWDDVICMDG